MDWSDVVLEVVNIWAYIEILEEELVITTL